MSGETTFDPAVKPIISETSSETFVEHLDKCLLDEENYPEHCAEVLEEVLTNPADTYLDAVGDGTLDILGIEDVDGTDKIFGNPTYLPLLFTPIGQFVVVGRMIDKGIGSMLTGGGDESLIELGIGKVAEDPWAAASLVSIAIPCNPVPGFAVYGISKLF